MLNVSEQCHKILALFFYPILFLEHTTETLFLVAINL